MSHPKPLTICILLGAGNHTQAVIDDLWHRAVGTVDPAEWALTGTAAYLRQDGVALATPSPDLQLVAFEGTPPSRLDTALAAAAAKAGPVGIIGRLLRDNLRSRRLARAFAQRKGLVDTFAGSAVVVSGDVSADRAVWQLRNRTQAGLVHGPVAMVHTLRTLARP